jgi:hypothetical protein
MQTRAVFGKASKFKLCLISLVSAEGMPSVSIFNNLNCQPNVKAHFEPQRVFPALSNLIVERDNGKYQIGLRGDAPGPFETRRHTESVAVREVRRASPERERPTTRAGGRANSAEHLEFAEHQTTTQKRGRGGWLMVII